MATKRKMPAERAAVRDTAQVETPKQEAERLGKQHMAVAANKARANLARGQQAAEIEDGFNRLKKFNPFGAISRALGGK